MLFRLFHRGFPKADDSSPHEAMHFKKYASFDNSNRRYYEFYRLYNSTHSIRLIYRFAINLWKQFFFILVNSVLSFMYEINIFVKTTLILKNLNAK